ncbi:MAG TPA: hypothetical protein VED47_08695, partial [Burkholderiaceae bacterium]|nr:hypothetical protein [Burkholderiaceae bacterium]
CADVATVSGQSHYKIGTFVTNKKTVQAVSDRYAERAKFLGQAERERFCHMTIFHGPAES